MLDKITGIEERYQDLNQLLMEVGDDYQRAAELNKERSELEPFIAKSQRYRQASQQLEEARSLAETDDEEFRLLAIAEMEQNLIDEGLLTAEQVTKMCDLHVAIFQESLDQQVKPETISGHPLHTYML